MATMIGTSPKGADAAERKRRARERLIHLSKLLDAAVEVPLLRTRVGLDALLGVVPVAGDIADVYFKAHMRNLRLLQKELGEPYLDLDQDGATVKRRS